MNFRPLADRVLIKPADQEEKTTGGIHIPDVAKEKVTKGTVIAVGPGRIATDGRHVEPSLKTGDYVVYGRYSGTEIEVEGTTHIILPEGDVFGVVE